MTAEKPTFQVVVVALERADIINRFIRYHLEIGAKRIVIFYDGPLPSDLPRHEAVRYIAMDADFWNRAAIDRPKDHIYRQSHAYRTTVKEVGIDWSLIIDIDEFLVSTIPFPEVLSGIPDSDQTLRIHNKEAVYGPGDPLGETFGATWFRTAMRPGRARRLMRALHGRRGDLLRKGVAAYSHGKHMIRNGPTDLTPGLHDSKRNGENVGRWLDEVSAGFEDTFIAHFDAIDFDHWVRKWRRRRGSPWAARNAEGARHGIMAAEVFKALAAGDDDKSARSLFATLYGATRWQAFWLRLFGQLSKQRVFEDPDEGTPYCGN